MDELVNEIVTDNSSDQHLQRLCEDIKRLYTELNDLRGHIASVEELADTQAGESDSEEVVRPKSKVAGLQHRIREFETSTSWRVTSPLRALKGRLGSKR